MEIVLLFNLQTFFQQQWAMKDGTHDRHIPQQARLTVAAGSSALSLEPCEVRWSRENWLMRHLVDMIDWLNNSVAGLR